jgi:hypothetical protein
MYIWAASEQLLQKRHNCKKEEKATQDTSKGMNNIT